ncbi:MAG: hypothetical protein LIO63_02615 [Akkermansia sp.]|nr:hypothetical protein [Akkermansia sp.]
MTDTSLAASVEATPSTITGSTAKIPLSVRLSFKSLSRYSSRGSAAANDMRRLKLTSRNTIRKCTRQAVHGGSSTGEGMNGTCKPNPLLMQI